MYGGINLGKLFITEFWQGNLGLRVVLTSIDNSDRFASFPL